MDPALIQAAKARAIHHARRVEANANSRLADLENQTPQDRVAIDRERGRVGAAKTNVLSYEVGQGPHPQCPKCWVESGATRAMSPSSGDEETERYECVAPGCGDWIEYKPTNGYGI